jgi:hypothetical protein
MKLVVANCEVFLGAFCVAVVNNCLRNKIRKSSCASFRYEFFHHQNLQLHSRSLALMLFKQTQQLSIRNSKQQEF